MSQKTMMLSIHQEYATQIFSGKKCVELRRSRPSITSGDMVVVYVSSPVKQVWGTFEVQRIIARPLPELWQIVRNDAGLTQAEFDKYFSGSTLGYGIYLHKVLKAEKPIDMSEIREVWKDFYPPQSYLYLSDSNLSVFTNFSINL